MSTYNLGEHWAVEPVGSSSEFSYPHFTEEEPSVKARWDVARSYSQTVVGAGLEPRTQHETPYPVLVPPAMPFSWAETAEWLVGSQGAPQTAASLGSSWGPTGRAGRGRAWVGCCYGTERRCREASQCGIKLALGGVDACFLFGWGQKHRSPVGLVQGHKGQLNLDSNLGLPRSRQRLLSLCTGLGRLERKPRGAPVLLGRTALPQGRQGTFQG